MPLSVQCILSCPPFRCPNQFSVISPLFFLACQNLTPQTIKTYLAGIRHMQITLGLPEPVEISSSQNTTLSCSTETNKQSHSFTDNTCNTTKAKILLGSIQCLSRCCYVVGSSSLLLCFFGFFRSGEITLSSKTAFNPTVHLAWGDVAIDNRQASTILKVHLKRSKSDQLGKGVDVFVGRIDNTLRPVSAVLSYTHVHHGM